VAVPVAAAFVPVALALLQAGNAGPFFVEVVAAFDAFFALTWDALNDAADRCGIGRGVTAAEGSAAYVAVIVGTNRPKLAPLATSAGRSPSSSLVAGFPVDSLPVTSISGPSWNAGRRKISIAFVIKSAADDTGVLGRIKSPIVVFHVQFVTWFIQ